MPNSPTFVAYNVPPDSKNPAVLEDVYSDDDPYGEYLFYVEGNERHTEKTDHKQSSLASTDSAENRCIDGIRVLRHSTSILYEVLVHQNGSAIAYTKSEIDAEKAEQYDNLNTIREPLNVDDKTVEEFMSLTPQYDKFQLQIGQGDDWAAVAFFNQEQPKLRLVFFKVADGRAIQIIMRCRLADANLGEIITHWEQLVERYKDMPFNEFTGAIEI